MNLELLFNRIEVFFWLLLLTAPLTVAALGLKTKKQVRLILLQIAVLSIYYLCGIIVAELRSQFNGSLDGISRIYQDDRFFIAEAQKFIFKGSWFHPDPHYTYASLITIFGRTLSVFVDTTRMTLCSVAVFINTYFYSLGAVLLFSEITKKVPELRRTSLSYLPLFVPFAFSLGIIPLRDTLLCGFALGAYAFVMQQKYLYAFLPFSMVVMLRPISGIFLGIALVVYEYLRVQRLRMSVVVATLGGIAIVLILSSIMNFDLTGEKVAGHWWNTMFKRNVLNKNRSDEIEESGGKGGVSMMMKAPPILRMTLVPVAFFLAPYPPKVRFDIPKMQGDEYAFEQIPLIYFEPLFSMLIFTSFILLLMKWSELPPIIKACMVGSFLSAALPGLITYDARHKILLWPLAYYATIYSFRVIWKKSLWRLAGILLCLQVILASFLSYYKLVL